MSAEDRIFGIRGQTVARVVKDPSPFAGHSLRSGVMTTASEAGIELAAIMNQSGHVSPKIALGYIGPAQQDRNPAARVVVDAIVCLPAEGLGW